MSQTKKDFFKKIEEIYEDIVRLSEKANFFIEENACGTCDICCTFIKTIPVSTFELDYIKDRNQSSTYDEKKFLTFLNRKSVIRCPNYSEDILGCHIYKTRPIVCRMFGYTLEPLERTFPEGCSYSNKENPVWPQMEQQLIKFNALKFDYYNLFFQEITPQTSLDYINLAEVLVKKDDIERAITFYDSAEKLFIESNDLRMFLTVRARKSEILGKTKEAIRTYYEILDLYPNDIKSLMKLSNLEFLLEKYDDCIQHLTSVLQYKKAPLIYNTIGLSYLRKGEYQKALETYDSALEQKFEDNQYLLSNKAMALQKLDRDQEAIALLLSILEKYDDKSFTHLSLSVSFQKIGEYQKSQYHLQEAGL